MKFRIDMTEVRALAGDPMMFDLVDEAADAVLANSRAASPYLTGAYRRRLHSYVYMTRGAWAAEIRTIDAGAVAIEFGSINNYAFAPITKGIRATGLRLEES